MRVIVEVENVHGEEHCYEMTKSFCAYGSCGAVVSGKKVRTSINTLHCVRCWCKEMKHQA